MRFLRRCGALLLGAALLALPATAQPAWQGAFQTDASNEGLIYSSVVDGQGDLFVAGFLTGSSQFGTIRVSNPVAGSLTGFVGKRSGQTGQWLWVAATGGASEVELTGLAVDAAGSVFVSGGFGGTATFGATTLSSPSSLTGFVARLTPAGQWDWVRTLGGGTSNTRAWQVAVAPAGGTLYAVGNFDRTAQLGTTTLTSQGLDDNFVVALAPATGQVQWARAAGGPGGDILGDIAVGPTGDLYLAGSFEGATTFGATTLTTPTYGPVVASLDPGGRWQWAASATGEGEAYSVATDPTTGAVAVTGYFNGAATFGSTSLASQGHSDGLLGFLDPATGAWQRVVAVGGSGGDLVELANLAYGGGGWVIVGSFDGHLTLPTGAAPLTFTSAGDDDFFVARYLPSANTWADALAVGGSGSELAATIALRSAGPPAGSAVTAYVGGFFTSPALAFGPASLTNLGNGQSFIGGPGFLADGQFSALAVGLADPRAESAFTLAPNPARTGVCLTLPSGTAATDATLTDATGRTVRAYPAGTTWLDLRGLPPGLYVVRCGATAQRLMVE